jgi:hypothetical protein
MLPATDSASASRSRVRRVSSETNCGAAIADSCLHHICEHSRESKSPTGASSRRPSRSRAIRPAGCTTPASAPPSFSATATCISRAGHAEQQRAGR